MRKRLSRLCAVALLTLCPSVAQAQTAQKIIDQHIKALGGAKALKAVTSVRLSGTANGGGEFLWQTRAPSSYYLEVRQRGDAHSVEAFNGKSAWREDKAAGARTLTGKEQARARAAGAHRNDHFLTYKKDKTRVNLLGRETVDGRVAFVVEITTAAGIQRKVFFDAQTYLLLKEEQERDGGKEEIFFSDYRAVDGVQEPQRIRIRRGGEVLDLAVQKAAHNASVEAAIFDFPRRDSAPLPEIAMLFKLVIENQKNLEKAHENYTYTKVENDIEIDNKGRIKEKSERTYEVFYVHGNSVEKLVAKDGKPLKDDEARKEQQRIEKRIRTIEENKKKEAERKTRDEQKKAEGKDKKKSEDEDENVSISNILRVCQFVNPRRERFRGQEVIVYDFEPRPGEKPRSRGESLIRTLVGAIWIDEQARQIARVEARMNDAFKMGGGLVASLQRGSSFVFEQEMVKGEVWLPSYAEVNASARVLLVKGFKINQTQRFSDYKKFNVETSSEIKPPKQ